MNSKQRVEERIEERNNELLGKYQVCRKSLGLDMVSACRNIYDYVTQLEPRGNRTRIAWAASISKRAEGINKHALNSYLVIGAGAFRLNGYDDLVQQWRKMSPLVALVRLPSDLFAEAVALSVLRDAQTVKDLSGVRVRHQCDEAIKKLLAIKPGPIVVNDLDTSAIPQQPLRPGKISIHTPTGRIVDQDMPLYPRKTEFIGTVADLDQARFPGIDQERPLFSGRENHPGWQGYPADALQSTLPEQLPLEGADASEVALGIYKQYGSEFAKKVKSLL